MAKAGRPKGSTAETVNLCKVAARRLHEKAMRRLDLLLDSRVETVCLGAVKEVLDRAWGKAAQAVELTGADGGAIETMQVSARETLADIIASQAARQSVDDDKPSIN